MNKIEIPGNGKAVTALARMDAYQVIGYEDGTMSVVLWGNTPKRRVFLRAHTKVGMNFHHCCNCN